MAQASDFADALNAVLQDAAAQLIVEIEQQGHNNTGKLVDSVAVSLKIEGRKIVGEVSALNYLDYINRPLRWQITRPSRPQIEGLTAWWKAKGLADKEAKGAAWAVAVNQIARSQAGGIGMPAPGSFRFSQNGKRTGSVQAAFGAVVQSAPQTFGDALRTIITSDFVPSLNREIKRI